MLEITWSLDRRKIIESARECVGTPFRHQGRLPQTGLDCVGLVRWPLVALAGVTEDYRAYGMHPTEAQVQAFFSRYFPEKIGVPEPGDILLIAIEGNGQHFAIYTDKHTIIHSLNMGPCRVVEHGYRHPWPSRCVGMFEYPGAEKWQP